MDEFPLSRRLKNKTKKTASKNGVQYIKCLLSNFSWDYELKGIVIFFPSSPQASLILIINYLQILY